MVDPINLLNIGNKKKKKIKKMRIVIMKYALPLSTAIHAAEPAVGCSRDREWRGTGATGGGGMIKIKKKK